MINQNYLSNFVREALETQGLHVGRINVYLLDSKDMTPGIKLEQLNNSIPTFDIEIGYDNSWSLKQTVFKIAEAVAYTAELYRRVQQHPKRTEIFGRIFGEFYVDIIKEYGRRKIMSIVKNTKNAGILER